MDRDNDTWLTHLRALGPERDAAIGDLREALLRGLRSSFEGRVPGGSAVLEDSVQEALLRILDRLSQFQGRSRFVTWATAIAIRTTMSELRRKRWKDVQLEDVVAERAAMDPRSGQAPLPPETLHRKAIVDRMYEVIHQELTDRQRTALLAELGGMPQDEIARHLGSNRNAVYKLTHDARKKLKNGLEALGYSAGDVQSAFTS